MDYIFEGHLVTQETWEYYWYYEDWDLYIDNSKPKRSYVNETNELCRSLTNEIADIF
ncbi:hypothetical protein [Piscibacillus salipiscarius]|uniref:Uncharacterized protein n=1 Tax=Piscibacillus salipiscarius TaxID=299480 RepID=A0ABW5Q794_9BACI|nr:hypothetical protein [Piscibacillus salipiscarius]